jgi:hypothetical protein
MCRFVFIALLALWLTTKADGRPLICPDSFVSGCQVLLTPDDRPNRKCRVRDAAHCRIPFPPTVENGRKVCRFECPAFIILGKAREQ